MEKLETVSLHSRIYPSKDEGASTIPLIILHGLFGMLDNWHTLASKFSEKREIHALDLRNHGRSPHHSEMSYELMGADVATYLDEKGLKEVYLMGHSMGGKVAMEVALTYPQKLAKLIVADIAPKIYASGTHESYIDLMNRVPIGTLTSRKEAEELLATEIRQPVVIQFLLKNLYRKDDNTFGWRPNLNALAEEYEEIIGGTSGGKAFNKPTLFIRGSQSNYVLDSDIPALKVLFPNAQIGTVHGAGHWLHAEKPQDFYMQVEDFLAGGKE